MAWCQTGNKPLSEPMLTQFLYSALDGDELTVHGSEFNLSLSSSLSHSEPSRSRLGDHWDQQPRYVPLNKSALNFIECDMSVIYMRPASKTTRLYIIMVVLVAFNFILESRWTWWFCMLTIFTCKHLEFFWSALVKGTYFENTFTLKSPLYKPKILLLYNGYIYIVVYMFWYSFLDTWLRKYWWLKVGGSRLNLFSAKPLSRPTMAQFCQVYMSHKTKKS